MAKCTFIKRAAVFLVLIFFVSSFFAGTAVSQSQGLRATPDLLCRSHTNSNGTIINCNDYNFTLEIGNNEVLIECEEIEPGNCVPSGEGALKWVEFEKEQYRQGAAYRLIGLLTFWAPYLLQIVIPIFLLLKYKFGSYRKFYKAKIALIVLMSLYTLLMFLSNATWDLVLLPFPLLFIQPILTIFLFLKTANELQKGKLLLAVLFITEIIFIIRIILIVSEGMTYSSM